jgi:hypothetical protein
VKHSGLIKEICELKKDKILQGENEILEEVCSGMLAYISELRTLDNYSIKQVLGRVVKKYLNFGHYLISFLNPRIVFRLR